MNINRLIAFKGFEDSSSLLSVASQALLSCIFWGNLERTSKEFHSMVGIILRVTAGFCFGGAALAWLTWSNVNAQLIPLETTLVLKTGETVSSSFVPISELPEPLEYSVRLQFTNTQQLSLNCQAVEKLKIRWTISVSQEVEKWDGVVGQTSSADYSCYDDGSVTLVRFLTSALERNTTYYLNLRVSDEVVRNQGLEVNGVRVHVIVEQSAGIETHYSLIDQAFSAFIGGGFLLIGAVCCLIDLVLVFRRLKLQSSSSAQRKEDGI
ncbi:hypothetical protein [Trichocoleus sp. FACHB-262]|uniref:hypothetical protein n=1 Tax=Trichocoleus sp. FACHB-262 TaxID=2692869 RepID=UPI001685D70A|nr:hypothetical protein [Trichocoleus sp. FACHB-262]MBD2123968.1 hypothetical protein [Trichocoleus sp. FACHB-262]